MKMVEHSESMRAIVLALDGRDIRLVLRTSRMLEGAGYGDAQICVAHDAAELQRALASGLGPAWLVWAGAWRRACDDTTTPLGPIPGSASGKPLLALGCVWDLADSDTRWASLLRKCGGDFKHRGALARAALLGQRPRIASAWLELGVARRLAAALAQFPQQTVERLIWRVAASRDVRVVHIPALDVCMDRRMRVLQLITTIHIGGAERVALDLTEELCRFGVPTALAAWGKPGRLEYLRPPEFFDLSDTPNDPESRASAVWRVMCGHGADLVHAHLIRGGEAAALVRRGLPVVMTIHNMPESWPPGLVQHAHEAAHLFLPCARIVEQALEHHIGSVSSRTVWNGIDPARFDARRNSSADVRAVVGWGSDDVVVVAVANPRMQKRLDRLPEIAVWLRERLDRPVRLLLVGAPARGNGDAEHSLRALEDAAIQWQTKADMHWTGGVSDVAPWLAASDVMVNVSAFEGLSLAQLEALAAGMPVVATAVGGASEIVQMGGPMRLVHPDATAAQIADAIVEALKNAPAREARISVLPRCFTREAMAARVARLYPAALARAISGTVHSVKPVLWLITNNFSTGGAQTSARRLLSGLRDADVEVRAWTIQEHPAKPTRGTQTLRAAGICVENIPWPRDGDAASAVGHILNRLATDHPTAVAFWNLIASYKLLLADALVGVHVWDVSPGEMWFASMDRYFAKPRTDVPIRNPAEYGARLAGAVVKYSAEGDRARSVLGCPVAVIPNGVPAVENARPSRKRSIARLIIGSAARLAPDKRVEDLLEALRIAHPRLPPYSVEIAGGTEPGSDDYARNLHKSAKGLPIRWRGRLNDPSEWLSRLDLFAMISEPAGCPNASLEALAAGVPVILTDHGGASEQVPDASCGRLVPRRDAAAFAEALIELAWNADLRKSVGAAGQDHVHKHFSMQKMVQSYRELFFRER